MNTGREVIEKLKSILNEIGVVYTNIRILFKLIGNSLEDILLLRVTLN